MSTENLTTIQGFIRPQNIFSTAIVKTTQDNIQHGLVTNTASKHFFDKSLLAVIEILN